MLDWIREGNVYNYDSFTSQLVPNHPRLSAERAHGMCITAFPIGALGRSMAPWYATVGTGQGQLLPGTYKYRASSSRGAGDRVNESDCRLTVNADTTDESTINLTYGEPFEFTFLTYHGKVELYLGCDGFLYRIGD